MIAENIKKLRLTLGKSQVQMAEEIGLSRSTLAGYECGSNEPNINKLKILASYFRISVDELVGDEVTKSIRREESLKVLAISIDRNDRENIELVPASARAGYLAGYQDPEYIGQLPGLRLPNMPVGTFRGFEISGDSMPPISEGSIILGQYLYDLTGLKNNSRYILVTKNDGIIFKRVIRESAEHLLLYSDNPVYTPYTLSVEMLLEVWSLYAFIGFPEKEQPIEIIDIVTRLNNIDNKLNKLLR